MFSNKGIVKVGQKFGPISENTLKKTEITPKVELFFLFLTYGIETPQSVLHYSSNDTCVEKFNALTCIKYLAKANGKFCVARIGIFRYFDSSLIGYDH